MRNPQVSPRQRDVRLPFAAVRTFECFARLDDIGGAASELGITPSAVSHQLRALETFLEVRLTERQGRRLKLTEAGRSYVEAVRPGLLLLGNATEHVRLPAPKRRVLVSSLPLIANGWLLPRLRAFMAGDPGIGIQIQYARHRNYSSDAADISLRFGTGEWPGYSSRKLLPGTVYPVCSPPLAARIGPRPRPRDLLDAPLVHDGTTEPWNGWFALAGVSAVARLEGLICEDGLLTRSAMLEGIGVALTRPPLIQQELASGSLVVISDIGFDDGQDYYLCVRNETTVPPEVRRVVAWLETASGSGGGHAPDRAPGPGQHSRGDHGRKTSGRPRDYPGHFGQGSG